MSAHTVSRAFLTCDGSCGAETPVAEDSMRARLQAARDGWKYATKPNTKAAGGRGARVTSLDYCPNCEVPSLTIPAP